MGYVSEVLSYNDITVNRSNHEMFKDNVKIKLSTKEFQILELLILNKGIVLTKEQFVQKIWGYDTEIEYNSIEVYVSFIRKKLDALKSKVTIKTIRGFGYTLGEK